MLGLHSFIVRHQLVILTLYPRWRLQMKYALCYVPSSG